ncbi:hypothetical protein BO82DRAFT_425737 [Aspergillus uvarum CBS 121591]|uniref:LysM domain-containing protein n=1 Tax=Aspergillus uvarum CBS 121591 TaxID=1448315 RepID=A0A319CHJ9_9EURO|nr:hypothetical protein BO82DRAFT_425737 [Aspergillus uvarum CBS 121591]PYH85135.1 hypothetical protein BO82DRAFT_425737 [Aspergillus uvarum CBS 121591]
MDDVSDLLQTLQAFDSGVWQYCGINSNRTLGLAVDLNGDLAAVQQYVRTWSDGQCVSGFTTTQTGSAELALTNTLIFNSSSLAVTNSTVHARSFSQSGISHTHSVLHTHRRSTCSYVQVVSGDSCASLVEECGITSDEFYDYNTASDLCSTLAVGQYVCCSPGTLSDFAPSPYANGTCYTYDVVSGDSCSLTTGPFTHAAANFFYNVKPLFGIDSTTWYDMQNSINATIRMNLVGAADCTQGEAHNTPATNATLTDLRGYGIDIEELLTNSEACQNATGVYFGSQSVSITAVASSGVLPTCCYNLPVLTLVPVSGLDPFEDSPCWINTVNATLSNVTVGQTYLLPNLVTIFDQDYCTCGYATVCKRTDGPC